MNYFKKLVSILLAMFVISSINGQTVTKAITGAFQDSSTTQNYHNSFKYTNGYNNFESLVVPTIINKGSCCSIGGKLFVGQRESSYRVGICVCSASYLSDGIDTKFRNRITYASSLSGYKTDRYFNLSELDNYIYFNNLPAGKYCYSIYMSIGNSGRKELYKCMFIVQNSNISKAYLMNNIAFSDYSLPTTINCGSCFSLKGNISALFGFYNSTTCYPSEVTGYIYYPNRSGLNWEFRKNVRINLSENRRSVALPSEIDNAMVFNYLATKNESYAYVMSIKDSRERYMIVKPFKVI
ncbi:MAG: hypothetical protein Q4D76_17850 [Oscillospiraceae bacterium]|nr:hypothetical protein [Oscillospiraceae bacterium]